MHRKRGSGYGVSKKFQIQFSPSSKTGTEINGLSQIFVRKNIESQYFPNTNFKQLELSNYHLNTWRNVWAAKKLLMEETVWRVGRGDNILIWQDAWVPSLKNHKIQEPVQNHSIDKVA
ncbi:hypothetical protein V6Z11_A07G089000 [Gossypium hirsutum]